MEPKGLRANSLGDDAETVDRYVLGDHSTRDLVVVAEWIETR
jgi:hypothetical protein